jgi:hypothetical protein
MKRRRLTKRLWQLREETHQEKLVHLWWRGQTTAQCARALNLSHESVRDLANTSAFQTAFEAYRREQWTIMARQSCALLLASFEALVRNLKSPDWKARQAAAELLLIHTKTLEWLAGERPMDPARSSAVGQPPDPTTVGVIPPEAMIDESRDLARKLMRSIRNAQPHPDVAARITSRVAAINGPDQN